MAIYPNQREIINIAKIDVKTFSLFRTEALQLAFNLMKGEQLKAWLYFSKNAPNFRIGTGEAAARCWGLTRDPLNAAIKRMEKLGYLVSKGGSSFYLCEFPDLDNEEVVEKLGIFTPEVVANIRQLRKDELASVGIIEAPKPKIDYGEFVF